jgi:hypothetical protein
MAAREVGSLTLADALAPTALIAEFEPSRFERAAVRWHGRFELDVKRTHPRGLAALSALATLAGPGAAFGTDTPARLARLYGVSAWGA